MILVYYTANKRQETIEQSNDFIEAKTDDIRRLRNKANELIEKNEVSVDGEDKITIKQVNTITGERRFIHGY